MFSDLPKLVEIEPTLTCNLRCRMCHVSYMPDEPRPMFPAELAAVNPGYERQATRHDARRRNALRLLRPTSAAHCSACFARTRERQVQLHAIVHHLGPNAATLAAFKPDQAVTFHCSQCAGQIGFGLARDSRQLLQ